MKVSPLILACILAVGCKQAASSPEPSAPATLVLSSSSFENGSAIPEKFSSYGANISPALAWDHVPVETKALALIVEDPDAPGAQPFVHWLLYDIPASVRSIGEGQVPAGATQGKNDNGTIGYFGPKPPSGTHHYHFKVYALDQPTHLKEGATIQELVTAMQGHALASGERIGTFTH